jgi:hypothetical protein
LKFFVRISPVLSAQDTPPPLAADTSSANDGPSVNGRSGMRIGMVGAESIPITVSINFNGTYDTLLGSFRTGSDGQLAPGGGSYGVEGGFSASGQKRFRRSVLGLSYIGNYTYFGNQNGFNGTNQALTLGYQRRLTRRLQLDWKNGASVTNRILGNLFNRQPDGLEVFSVPLNELFDTRIYFLQSNMNVSYAINNRLQVFVGGSGGLVRRANKNFADVNIFGATAGATYRVNRLTTVSANYGFSHFNFGRSFGESNVHSVSGSIARQIGKNWQIAGGGSWFRVNTIGVRQIALDPLIAALLGTNTGAEAFNTTNNLTGYNASLERRFRRSSFTVRGEKNVQPGNGLFLATSLVSYGVSYNYRTSANWGLSANARSDSMDSLGGQGLGNNFSTRGVGLNFDRRLTQEIRLNAGYEFRRLRLAQTAFDRSGSRFIFGLSYNPTSLGFLTK